MLTIYPGALSSCTENTILTGLNYLKDQPPVVAMADSEYPDWLWTVLKPKTFDDEGVPGGQAERKRMREEARRRIKEQNFMKTQ